MIDTIPLPGVAIGTTPVTTPAETHTAAKKLQAANLPPLLFSARDLAAALRVSVPTIWRLRAAGKLPRPLDAMGAQLLRWDADEIQRWIKAKMPDLKTWDEMSRNC